MKIALGIVNWELRTGKLLFGRHFDQKLELVPFAKKPNAQLSLTNAKAN